MYVRVDYIKMSNIETKYKRCNTWSYCGDWDEFAKYDLPMKKGPPMAMIKKCVDSDLEYVIVTDKDHHASVVKKSEKSKSFDKICSSYE